jgi:hypothetical protein
MSDPWLRLQDAAEVAIQWIWQVFAKHGREAAILAAMSRFPKASGWLAACMSMSDDTITRKIGVMLAGWIDDPEQTDLLSKMLDKERSVYTDDPITANSVAEDIMFAATRWSRRAAGDVQAAGVRVLSEMISDAIHGTHWNTSHWAAGNLYAATNGAHGIFTELMAATPEQLADQQFLSTVVIALRSGKGTDIEGYIADPTPKCELPAGAPNYAIAQELWDAAQEAEYALKPDRAQGRHR